jgi:hypothetical protein
MIMPKYKLNKRHYLNDRIYRAGETVDWDGPPSLSMVPLDDAAKKDKDNWDRDRAQRQSSRKSVGWSPALKTHEWNRLTRPDPELVGADGESAPPTANINIIGRPKSRGRPPRGPRVEAATAE